MIDVIDEKGHKELLQIWQVPMGNGLVADVLLSRRVSLKLKEDCANCYWDSKNPDCESRDWFGCGYFDGIKIDLVTTKWELERQQSD